MPFTPFSQEKQQHIFAGAATLLALDVAAYIVLHFLSHPSSTGSFIPTSGAEIFIPFLLTGLVAGVLTLIFTSRGNIILALALQILITVGGFFGAAYWQTATRNQEITQMARQEYETCRKAYEQNKNLFSIRNFKAEPIKNPQNGKVETVKVTYDVDAKTSRDEGFYQGLISSFVTRLNSTKGIPVFESSYSLFNSLSSNQIFTTNTSVTVTAVSSKSYHISDILKLPKESTQTELETTNVSKLFATISFSRVADDKSYEMTGGVVGDRTDPALTKSQGCGVFLQDGLSIDLGL